MSLSSLSKTGIVSGQALISWLKFGCWLFIELCRCSFGETNQQYGTRATTFILANRNSGTTEHRLICKPTTVDAGHLGCVIGHVMRHLTAIVKRGRSSTMVVTTLLSIVLDKSLVMCGNKFQKRVCLMTMAWFELEVVHTSTIGQWEGIVVWRSLWRVLARIADQRQMLVSLRSTEYISAFIEANDRRP
jgi:hypothetical protein